MPGSANAKNRKRYDVSLNYFEVVNKNTDYFSKEERYTSYSIYETKPVDPINQVYFLNLTDAIMLIRFHFSLLNTKNFSPPFQT
jgi:hypothetical protein